MKTTLQVLKLRLNKSSSFTDFIVLLNDMLGKKGYRNVFVFTDAQSERLRNKIEEQGGEIIVIKNSWENLGFVKQLFAIIRQYKPKIIDFHFCSSLSLVPLLIWLRIFRPKTMLIFHYHGEIIPIDSLRLKNLHFSRLRMLTLLFHKIITVSRANERFLRALNIRKNIEVIYNGIDINNFIDKDALRCRREYNIPEGDLIISSISTLIPRKGFDVLLRALAKVIAEVKNIKVFIVGRGELETMCKKLTEDLGIGKNVIFTGFIEEFPYHILSATDIYASASNSESFGIVYAEAMAFKVPVVATNVGGIPEVVAEGVTGLLVSPKNEELLSKAIVNLVRDKHLREAMGERGRKRVEEMFNLEDRVRELIVQGYNL